MEITIRQQSEDDYTAMTGITNASMPDYPTTSAEMRRHDDVRDPKCRYNRLIAACDGVPVGLVSYGHMEWMYHPKRFEVFIHVVPEHRRQGIGSRLFDAAIEDLESGQPEAFRSFAREDMPGSVRFLEKRGFREEERNWESRLDVTNFDPTRFPCPEERLRGAGVELTTFGRLATDPDRDAKMYAMMAELVKDLPSPEPLSEYTFEQYRRHELENPNLLPDGITVAVHGDEYIGVSALWKSSAHPDLETGLTAVRRPWRRHGIALAMKLRAIEFARRYGASVIRTDNEVNNVGMLTINERLGFVKMPVWIGYVKTI